MNFTSRNGMAMFLSVVMMLAGSLSATMSAQSQDGKHVVTGTVIDENGIPLIGAGIVSEDGKRGAVTDLDGRYAVMTPLPPLFWPETPRHHHILKDDDTQ